MPKAYTYEELEALVKKFETARDFAKAHNGAYQVIMKNKKFRPLRKNLKNTYKSYTFKEIKQLASQYQGRLEFQYAQRAAYTFAMRRKWLDKICSHMEVKCNSYTNAQLKNNAKRFKSLKEYREKEKNQYSVALRRGLVPEISQHMDRRKSKLSFKDLKNIALKYKTIQEWRTGKDSGAYSAAKNRKILPQITRHMTNLRTQKKYSKEEIQQTALKYSRRIDFMTKDSAVYKSAQTRGLLNKVCSHMVYSQKLLEKVDQEKIVKSIKSNFPNVSIQEQFMIKQGSKRGYVDLLLTFPTGHSLAVEIKSDRKAWSENSLRRQVEKYNQGLKNPKFLGTTIVSLKGKYGMNLEELLSHIYLVKTICTTEK